MLVLIFVFTHENERDVTVMMLNRIFSVCLFNILLRYFDIEMANKNDNIFQYLKTQTLRNDRYNGL